MKKKLSILVAILVIGAAMAALFVFIRPLVLAPGLSPELSRGLSAAEIAQARLNFLVLSRKRADVVADLARHLEAPRLTTNAPETWGVDSPEALQRMKTSETALQAYVAMLVANTEGLSNSQTEESPNTIYGRKILEARRLYGDYRRLSQEIEVQRKRARISTDDFSPTESK